ncbi:MAG: hypothetical protein IJB34_01980 [Clostridia bacterium]|nr:hypothetical protein [Clostridia bacterium]
MANQQTEKAQALRSEFNGGMLGYLGISLLTFIHILFTLTIGTAWAMCRFWRWQAKHTKLNGKQVVFTGKGGELFSSLVIWFLLGVITVGIFWLWVPVKMEKWRVEHTRLKEHRAVAAEPDTAEEIKPEPTPFYTDPSVLPPCVYVRRKVEKKEKPLDPNDPYESTGAREATKEKARKK